MPSTVRVLRPRAVMVDGVLESTWSEVPGLTRIRCRIDVNFYRPGKDMPMPIQAGRAPDRVAVYTAPDRAQNMRHLHHLEGQIVEVAPSVASGALSGGG